MQPELIWWAAGAIGALLLVSTSRQSHTQKDPARAFDAHQRRAGFARAGHQCEFSTPWFTRCTRTATHADHFYPHAKGGASSMRNLVASCAAHNLSKGAKLPSFTTKLTVQRRRSKYFPAGLDRTAGQWFR